MTPAHGDDASGLVPFVLPGPPPARETLAGWQQWRATRGSFTPAPQLDRAAWRALPPRRRMLHNLHRAATHANLPLQQTPMSQAVTRVLRGRVESNALKHKPSTRAGVMITGGGYQGKTETACEVAAGFEDAWLELHHHLNPDAVPGARDLHAPVAYVQTPVTAKPKSTCEAILDFFGADHHKMTLPQLTRAVRTSLHDHGVRALLLDDITRLKMHRADDQDSLDLLRAFMSMHTTLVLIGVDIPGSGLLREGRHDPRTEQWVFPPPVGPSAEGLATQTERRFDLVHLEAFRYDTDEHIAAWTAHLAGLEQQLRLLERLVEDGCTEALDSGVEQLTEPVLDQVTINLGNDPGRDATAGEVPPVPAAPPRPSRAGRRPRNTVFDDPGVPPRAAGTRRGA